MYEDESCISRGANPVGIIVHVEGINRHLEEESPGGPRRRIIGI